MSLCGPGVLGQIRRINRFPASPAAPPSTPAMISGSMQGPSIKKEDDRHPPQLQATGCAARMKRNSRRMQDLAGKLDRPASRRDGGIDGSWGTRKIGEAVAALAGQSGEG